jgi:hypothetical protein
MLRNYIRAKVILGGCSLVFYATVMLLMRFPYATGLGFLGGVEFGLSDAHRHPSESKNTNGDGTL